MRTMRVEFQVPIGDGLAAMTGIGPRVTVSTEVVLSDETEEAAYEAGGDAYEQISAFINGWGSKSS